MFSGKSRWFCVTAAVVALAFSGWASAQQTPTAKPEPKPQAQPAPEGKDLVQTAMDAKFNTLCELLKDAGLVETLQGPGPFTVFAPTNDAFAALPAGLVDALLLPENKETLTKILTLHVVAGKPREALVKGVIDHMAFSGSGLADTVARLKARGVAHELRRLPGYGTWQLFFEDPNRAKIEIDFDPAETV